ncbi:hypothetical protein [Cryobacterium sp. AP23]
MADVSRFHRGLIRLALATAFLSGLDVVVDLGGVQVTHIVLALALILTMLASRHLVPAGVLGLFFLLMTASCVSILATEPTFAAVVDRVLDSSARVALAVFMIAAFYAAFVLAGRSVQAFFGEYLKVATFFATVGIAQEVIFLVAHVDVFGFLPTGAKEYGAYLGISGLSIEPAFYACALLPAGAYYVVRFVTMFRVSWPAIGTVAAIILSTSSNGYLGLVAAAVIAIVAGMRLRRIGLLILIIPALALAVYWMLQQEFVQLRLQDTLTLLELGVTTSTGANLSSYALAVNSAITIQSLTENQWFGAGFGLYNVVFEHYIGGYQVPVYRETLPGSGSATSFLLRMVAELGIFGVAIIAATVMAFIRAIRAGINRPIAIACLAAFAVILLRMGEYFENGVMFVLVMAFVLHREALVSRQNDKGASPAVMNYVATSV